MSPSDGTPDTQKETDPAARFGGLEMDPSRGQGPAPTPAAVVIEGNSIHRIVKTPDWTMIWCGCRPGKRPVRWKDAIQNRELALAGFGCLCPRHGIAALEHVDHTLTDPPYAKTTTTRIVVNPFIGGKAKTQAQRTSEVDRIQTLGPCLPACEIIGRITRRWAVVWSDAESHHLVRAALEDGGHQYVRFGFWRKPDSMPQITGDRPAVGGEACTITHPKGRKRWNGGGKHAFWPHNTVKGAARPDHPTPKPVALMLDLVRDFTDQGELICDPFAGSGTTGVAAVSMGRRFIGFERDPLYFELAVERISKTRQQFDLFSRVQPNAKQEKLLL